jgi:pyrroloquinoline quinone (PQQ) biosynthesis protein C
MATVDEKLHEKIAAGLSDSRVSPAVLALKMLKENTYTNEQLLGYLVNYVIIMSEQKVIPMQLAEIQQTCKSLKISLEELGLTGTIKSLDTNEYLIV